MRASTRASGINDAARTIAPAAGRATPAADALRAVWRRRSAAAGLVVVGTVTLVALLAPLLAPHDPIRQAVFERLRPPGSAAHVLGTDHFGRDLLSRLMYGARVSLLVGVLSVAVASGAGTAAGVLAGYFGGILDQTLMAVVEVLMAFPLILLAIAIVAVLGGGVMNVMLAVGIANVPAFARLARAEIVRHRGREYVEAARALGAGHRRLITRHLLPNSWSPIIVLMTLKVSTAILTEATLSYLGLGISPPTPTWGTIIADGTRFLPRAPWISLAPGLAIVATVLGFNLLGDGIRDALDPRLRGEYASAAGD